MRYSRSTIIFTLVAVEVVIGGMILSALGLGHHTWGWGRNVQAATLRSAHFTAAAVAPIDAGERPHVVVDDPQSRIVVTVSSDGRVHVTDDTRIGGSAWSSSEVRQLQVTRTPDGVQIVRPGESHHTFFVLFGWSTRRVEIALPAGATLDVRSCSGADVAGLNGNVRVRSQDGHITLDTLSGDVDAASDDGSVQARNVHAHSVALATSDGHLSLDDVSAAALVAATNDGGIDARGLRLDGSGATGRLHSDDGSIRLAFDGPGNLQVRAHTGDGRISVDGVRRSRSDDDDSSDGTFSLGDGSAGTLDVSTADGSISVTTNGAR